MSSKLIFLLSFFCNFLFAQNLVYNGSFEMLTQCPEFSTQIELTGNWYNASVGDADLFNSCSSSELVGVPINIDSLSYQLPRTGSGYAGIYSYVDDWLYSEVIQQKLNISLQNDVNYCISFYVSLSNDSKYGIDNLGLLLSEDSVFSDDVSVTIGISPTIKPTFKNCLIDTLNWTVVQGIYKATSNEKFLTIGRLEADSLTNVEIMNPISLATYSYYYIEDISITECRPPVLASDTLIDEGQSVIIGDSSQDVANYFWSPSVGLACDTCWQTTASPTVTTTYTLTKITPCDTTQANITISVTPTPPNPNPDFHFSLKPNPSSNFIELGFGFLKLESTVKIYDLQGRIVLIKNIPKEIENYTITIQHLAAGQYTLVFENSEFFVRKRVTKI
jgi:hypothetical protein